MFNLMLILQPFINIAFNILVGLGILFVGLAIIKNLDKGITNFIGKFVKDETVEKFLHNLIVYSLKVIVLLMAITKMGVETASLVAVIGAIGFAIGLAFQGALSNFAGGVLLLTLRPFSVNDFIEINGKSGVVSEITILNTTLQTPDNKVITIPNGVVSNTNIENYTKLDKRRVDIVVGVGYKEDILKVKNTIMEVVKENKLILNDMEAQIVVSNLSESSVDYSVRVWTDTENYWSVYFYLFENIKIAFDREGIEIPYNKLDVNITK